MKNTATVTPAFCLNCGSHLRWAEVDGENRWHCSSKQCDFVVWDNPVPVVAAIVRVQGKLLLARNANWPAGVQSIISGYLEKGESPEHAVVRELREETGLSALQTQLLGLYVCHELNQILLVYVIDAKGEISLGPELLEYSLVPHEQMNPQLFGFRRDVTSWSDMGMGVGPAIEDYMRAYHGSD